jgi:hypothetical protein
MTLISAFAAVAAVAVLLAVAPAFAADAESEPPADPAARKQWVLHEVLRRFQAGKQIEPELYQEFSKAQVEGLKTGPDVGRKVPNFTLPDQNGKPWSLGQLMGPKGLVLSFQRSADW